MSEETEKRSRRIVKQLSHKVAPIATEMILPNTSGDHVRSIKRAAPVDDKDLVNKEYVDNAIPSVKLNDIENPDGNAAFNMSNKQIKFSFVAPNVADGGFEIEASGGFSGDLVHIHQHTGNPGAVDLVHLEADDADVDLLHLDSNGGNAIHLQSGEVVFVPLTASEILALDGSKQVQTLAVATYPSLTELSYVKGVTSAIQTQLGAIEGTAIKSTGEGGGTKFLREDGDNSCSWQAAAGGGGATPTFSSNNGGSNLAAGQSDFMALSGDSADSTDENTRKNIVARDGTFQNAYFWARTNNVNANSFAILRINGADGNISITITNSTSGVFSDLVNTDAVNAGDRINWEIDMTAAGGGLINDASCAVEFAA